MTTHHAVLRRVAPGVTEIARPLPYSLWWLRGRAERECRDTTGHCWHADETSLIGWWCCMCSGETESMPKRECVYCLDDEAATKETA